MSAVLQATATLTPRRRRRNCLRLRRRASGRVVYMQARFYDPQVGRFLSTDPVHFSDQDPFTFNRYAYGNNNPYRYTDPDGQSAWSMLGRLILKGGDIAATAAGAVEDFSTLTDSSASTLDRVVAGASLISELGPVSARDVKAVANAAADLKKVPDSDVVVRGGTGEVPPAGEVFSGAAGPTLNDAAKGVPYGQLRETTAGKIREGGGTVAHAPEKTRSGATNDSHVNVCLGCGSQPFGELKPNPVPRDERIK